MFNVITHTFREKCKIELKLNILNEDILCVGVTQPKPFLCLEVRFPDFNLVRVFVLNKTVTGFPDELHNIIIII